MKLLRAMKCRELYIKNLSSSDSAHLERTDQAKGLQLVNCYLIMLWHYFFFFYHWFPSAALSGCSFLYPPSRTTGLHVPSEEHIQGIILQIIDWETEWPSTVIATVFPGLNCCEGTLPSVDFVRTTKGIRRKKKLKKWKNSGENCRLIESENERETVCCKKAPKQK